MIASHQLSHQWLHLIQEWELISTLLSQSLSQQCLYTYMADILCFLTLETTLFPSVFYKTDSARAYLSEIPQSEFIAWLLGFLWRFWLTQHASIFILLLSKLSTIRHHNPEVAWSTNIILHFYHIVLFFLEEALCILRNPLYR